MIVHSAWGDMTGSEQMAARAAGETTGPTAGEREPTCLCTDEEEATCTHPWRNHPRRHCARGVVEVKTARSWPENALPTAEQLAQWLTVCTADERLGWTTGALRASETAHTCFIRNHAALEDEVQAAWTVAATRRNEARRYWLAWQSARLRALFLRERIDTALTDMRAYSETRK